MQYINFNFSKTKTNKYLTDVSVVKALRNIHVFIYLYYKNVNYLKCTRTLLTIFSSLCERLLKIIGHAHVF